MINEQEPISFGNYLKSIRLEKEISLDAISEETCIRRNLLHSIEKEEHDQLPEEVFVKGFLRAYAKAIGADGDKAVRLYLSEINKKQNALESETDSQPVIQSEKDVPKTEPEKNTLKSESEKEKKNKKFLIYGLIVGGILIGIFLLAILMISAPQERSVSTDAYQIKEPAAVSQPPKPLSSETSPVPDKEILKSNSLEVTDMKKEETVYENSSDVDEKTPQQETDKENNVINSEAEQVSQPSEVSENADSQQKPLEKLSLKIKAIKKTWLNVKTDDGPLKYYDLKTGDNLELEGSSNFHLIIGNGSRVELTLNDKPITDFANKKERVEFSIP